MNLGIVAFDAALAAISGMLLIPVLVLGVEVAAAIAGRRRSGWAAPANALRPRVAVVVPAHDESANMLPTLHDIQQQLLAGDRLLVVADNCHDDTANMARSAGAEVCERNDPERRGKGYALDYGINRLAQDPPEVAIVIDADCRIGPGAIDNLARAAGKWQRPVQALYEMLPPQPATIDHRIRACAWILKTQVRSSGLAALGSPCNLLGTGMALPWHLARSSELATGHIVEDLKLGLELAEAGHGAKYLPSAVVSSSFPVGQTAAATQHARWEHGSLQVMLCEAPRVLITGLARGDMHLVMLALDNLVPPIGMLIGSLVLWNLAVLGLAVAGLAELALAICGAGFALLMLTLIFAWHCFGREVMTSADLTAVPLYVWKKLVIYRDILRGRHSAWTRTDRE